MHDRQQPIGDLAREVGLSPRMLRYLEQHGVVAPDRGPHGSGHRHYPPPEARIARAAAAAMRDGEVVATLRAIRSLADARVAAARRDGGSLAWFELLALARAAELAARPEDPRPLDAPRRPEDPRLPEVPRRPEDPRPEPPEWPEPPERPEDPRPRESPRPPEAPRREDPRPPRPRERRGP